MPLLSDRELKDAITRGFKQAWPRSECSPRLLDSIFCAIREQERTTWTSTPSMDPRAGMAGNCLFQPDPDVPQFCKCGFHRAAHAHLKGG